MGTFSVVTRAELRIRKKLSPEELALFDQFKIYLSKIHGSEAAVYHLAQNEDRERCKKLLRRAARALELQVKIIEDDASLIFYWKGPRKTKS